MNYLKPLSKLMESFLPENFKTQMKAGYRDGNLRLTDRGVRNLLEILAKNTEVDAALTVKAAERVAAQEAKKEVDCSEAC